MNASFREKYKESDSLSSYNELSQIKQARFPTIQLYAASIN